MNETTQTYAEATGHEPFNWLKWLDAAIKKTPCRMAMVSKRAMAANWPTCAVGNLCSALPRALNGQPEDIELRKLGTEFGDNICGASDHIYWGEYYAATDHLVAARDTFLAIEARAAELLKAMGVSA